MKLLSAAILRSVVEVQLCKDKQEPIYSTKVLFRTARKWQILDCADILFRHKESISLCIVYCS